MTSTPVAASLDPDRLAPEADDPEVGTVMRDEVVFCLPSTPADAIAKLLGDNILSELVVLVDRRPVGYVAKEDIIDHLVEGDIMVAGSDFAVRPPSTACRRATSCGRRRCSSTSTSDSARWLRSWPRTGAGSPS